MRRRRGIMGLNGGAGIPIITATATGNPLSFITDMVRPLKSLVIPFTPIQSGSGDPSPDNVRPISGWTGVNIEQRGKNLLDSSDYSGIRLLRYSDGTFTETGTDGGPFGGIYFCRTYKNGTRIGNYSLVDDGAGRKALNITVNVGDIDTIQIGFLTLSNNAYVDFKASDVIVESGTYNISYNVVTVPTSNTLGAFNDVQISKTDSSYESYHGTTLPITFTGTTTGEPMTIYGGSLTTHEDGTGTLVATQGIINHVDDLWGYPYRGHRSGAIVPSGMMSMNGWAEGKCNMILPRSTGGVWDTSNETPSISWGWGDNRIYLWKIGELAEEHLGYAPTEAEIIEWLNNNNFTCNYPLATPVTYELTAEEVGQLITYNGTNNIWTDTNGTNTATYLKHQS